MKEKRNIHELIVKEEPHLHEILDPEQVTKFKELTNELRDTWTKKQMFRTKTEMEFSVLNDANVSIFLFSASMTFKRKLIYRLTAFLMDTVSWFPRLFFE